MTSEEQPAGLLAQVSNSLAELVERVLPAVVTLQGLTTALEECSGSGFAIDQLGHVVTNFHVVDGMGPRLGVVAHGGLSQHGTVVGIDPVTDLAVLRLEAPLTTSLTRRSRPPRLGELCIALGSPLGEFTESVSIGIVSGLDRTIEGSAGQWPIEHALQTDAAINPGNSGGPLVDAGGTVLGVNQSIVGHGAQNLGFAVPAETVSSVATELIAFGEIRRAALGVRVAAATVEVGGRRERHLVVISVADGGSPLREGDALIRVGGHPIGDRGDLFRALSRDLIGVPTDLEVIRNGAPFAVTVVPSQSQPRSR